MQGESGEKPCEVRGYMVVHAAAYLSRTLGYDEAERVIARMSPTTREALAVPRPTDWVPASAFSELNRAVADLAHGDEARARDLLIGLGAFVAEEAEKTFLKLLLELITPEHFANKIPDLFRRDFSRGTLLVDLGPERIFCRTHDLAGLDHVACTAAGFVSHVLTRLGKTVRTTTIHGWSLAEPDREGASFELTW